MNIDIVQLVGSLIGTGIAIIIIMWIYNLIFNKKKK